MKIFTIAIYDLIKLSREKTALLIMFLIPIIFTLVMGAAFGNFESPGEENQQPKIPIGIASLDRGTAAKALIDEINRDKTVYVVETTESELINKVKNAQVELGLVIPGNFSERLQQGEQPELKTLKLPNSADFMAIQNIVGTAFSSLHVKEGTRSYFEDVLSNKDISNKDTAIEDIVKKVGEELEKPPFITVELTKQGKIIADKGFNPKSQVSVGVMVMFVMFSVVFAAGEVLEEKKTNTWGRLGIAPLSKSSMVLGKVLGTFLRGWIQIIILIIFGSLFMGVNWGNSLGASFVILSTFLLAVTCLGLLFAAFVKTNSQLGAFGSVLIVCTSMLSGCYWPVEMEPLAMQRIAAFFPQYWTIKALSNTVGSGLGIGAVTTHLTVLLLMAAVFFIASILAGGFRIKALDKDNS